MPERVTVSNRSEKSAEVVVVGVGGRGGTTESTKDRTRRSVRGREYVKGHASDVNAN